MSVRHSKHLSILLFYQAAQHREKNVPTQKEKKNNSEIKKKKRKTYKPYLGFHSKQIL